MTLDADYESASGLEVIESEDVVEVKGSHSAGGISGDWYRYVGATPGISIDLSREDFSNSDDWESLGSATGHKSTQFITALTGYMDDNLGLDNFMFDSFSQATATGG